MGGPSDYKASRRPVGCVSCLWAICERDKCIISLSLSIICIYIIYIYICIYIYIYIYIYTCIIYIYICTHHVCIHLKTYVRTYTTSLSRRSLGGRRPCSACEREEPIAVYLSIYLSICLSVYLSDYLPICLWAQAVLCMLFVPLFALALDMGEEASAQRPGSVEGRLLYRIVWYTSMWYHSML